MIFLMKIIDDKNYRIFFLLIISVFIVYFVPFRISQFVFFVLLPYLIYKSNNNYFWVAFIFILLDAPGGLFSYVSNLSYYQLPYIKVSSAQAIYFIDIIPFIFLIKALLIRKRADFIFKKEFKFLFIYLILVLFYTLFRFEMYYGKYYQLFIIVGYWSLLYSLPKLLDFNDIMKLDKLLFPFVFVALFLQIVGFLFKIRLIDIFNPSVSISLVSHNVGIEIYRIVSNIVIVLYCFIKAFFYYFSRQKFFSSKYLTAIIITSILSIFVTATRGWIIAMFVSLGLLFFYNSGSIQKVKKLLTILLSLLLIVILLTLFLPIVREQIVNTWVRLSTISDLIEGDATAGGTLTRLTDRRFPMEETFKKEPIFGWGFSNTFFYFDDHHVGMLVVLLNVGIVGLIIFVVFFLWLLYKIWRLSKIRSVRNYSGNSLMAIVAGIIFIFIIHSSSHTMWGFWWPGEADRLLFVLLLVAVHATIVQSVDIAKKE